MTAFAVSYSAGGGLKIVTRTLAGLHHKRQLGVDAVGILLALLDGGHFDGWAAGDWQYETCRSW